MGFIEMLLAFNYHHAIAGGLGGLVRSLVNEASFKSTIVRNATVGGIMAYYFTGPANYLVAMALPEGISLAGPIAISIGILGVESVAFLLAVWKEHAIDFIKRALSNGKQ